MPVKKDQNWTDDDAFYDEAWADMARRLNAEPKRDKKAAPPWPFYLGAVAVFLLVIGVAAGILSDRENVDASPPTPPFAAEAMTDKTVGNPNLASDGNKVTERELLTEETTKISTSKSTSKNKSTEQPDDGRAKNTSTDASGMAPTTPQRPAGKMESQLVRIPAGSNSFMTKDEETKPGPKQEISVGDERITFTDRGPVVPALAGSPLLALELSSSDFKVPSVANPSSAYRNALTVEAGVASAMNLQRPGVRVGIGYRINGGKKLTFPLSLRYRLEELEIQDFPGREADQAGVSVSENYGEYFFPRSISTTSLEFGAGPALVVAPRLRLSTGLTAAYQLRALVNLDSRNASVNFDNRGGLFGSSADFSVALDRGFNLLASQNSGSSPADLSRWALRANFGVEYDVAARLAVRLRATHLIKQPDRAKEIGLQTGQLELGLSYRLR